VDAAKLMVDLSRLATDVLAGKGELALVGDVAAALYDQVGAAKLSEIGAFFIAHAASRVPADDAFPVQSDEPQGGGQPMTGGACDADPHSGP
jgi:hypothetical protein